VINAPGRRFNVLFFSQPFMSSEEEMFTMMTILMLLNI